VVGDQFLGEGVSGAPRGRDRRKGNRVSVDAERAEVMWDVAEEGIGPGANAELRQATRASAFPKQDAKL
jgi:hypothetical protein